MTYALKDTSQGDVRKVEEVDTDMNMTKWRSLWRPTHWFIPAKVEYRAELNVHKTHTGRKQSKGRDGRQAWTFTYWTMVIELQHAAITDSTMVRPLRGIC